MRSPREWVCGACTLSNPHTAEQCTLCGGDRSGRMPAPASAGSPAGAAAAGRPPARGPTGASVSEAKADDATSAFARDLQNLAHPPTAEELLTQVATLTSEADGLRDQLRRRDEYIAEMRSVVYDLRELLWREREDRRATVNRLWDDIVFLSQSLERAELAVGAGQSSDIDGAVEGATGASAGAAAGAAPAVAPALVRSTSEQVALGKLTKKVTAIHTLRKWMKLTEDAKMRTKNFIIARTFTWRERAQRMAQRKADLRASDEALRTYLLDQQHRGLPLSVGQVNFLKAKDHTDGKLYDCPVCFDEFTLDNIIMVDECLHVLCTGCMRQFLVTAIKDGRSTYIECPEHGCKRRLTADEVKMGLGDDTASFARYMDFLLQDHLESDPDMVRCPKPRCQTPMIKGEHTTMVVCPSPSCKYSFCARCKVEWHADTTCEKYQQWLKENGSAADLFEAWKKQNTKPCPKESGGCGRDIQKSGGCNHMHCTRCGFDFCWLCLQKYKSGHFSRGSGTPCAGKQFT